MEFVLLAIPVIFGITSVYLANKAVQKGCKKKSQKVLRTDRNLSPPICSRIRKSKITKEISKLSTRAQRKLFMKI